jgi:Leo1-like protein
MNRKDLVCVKCPMWLETKKEEKGKWGSSPQPTTLLWTSEPDRLSNSALVIYTDGGMGLRIGGRLYEIKEIPLDYPKHLLLPDPVSEKSVLKMEGTVGSKYVILGGRSGVSIPKKKLKLTSIEDPNKQMQALLGEEKRARKESDSG